SVRKLTPTPPAWADEGRLGQVFVNLIVNAAQAMPEKKRGEIVLRSLQHDGKVGVEITDNGSGISADVLPRIFEPFFTTKGGGRGTGLGLWIAERIVRSFGGRIDVKSEVGKEVGRASCRERGGNG